MDIRINNSDDGRMALSPAFLFPNGTIMDPTGVGVDAAGDNFSASILEYPKGWMDETVDEFKRGLFTYQETRTILLIIIYGVIFLLALGGNVLVLLVIVANNSMRNVTNFFLLNLALSDLLGTYHYEILCLHGESRSKMTDDCWFG